MNKTIENQLHSQLKTIKQKLQNNNNTQSTSHTKLINEFDQSIISEAQQALHRWQASPEGKTILKQLPSCGIEQLRSLAPQILHSHYFDRTMTLIKTQNAQAKAEVSLPVKSIAIGLFGEVDLLAGLVASAGYALDISDFGQTAAVYVGGGIVEGISEGFDAGIELSLWANETSDLAGYYNCQELSAGYGIDVNGVSYEKDDSLAGISVGVDLGEYDGIDEWEYYMLTFSVDHYPVYQAGDANHFLILGDLVCVNKYDLNEHDEVSLTFRPDGGTTYRYPTWDTYSMSEDPNDPDHTWNLGRSIKYNDYVDLYLWVGNDDHPTVRVNFSDFSSSTGTVSKTFYRDGSISNGWNEIKYTLSIQNIF